MNIKIFFSILLLIIFQSCRNDKYVRTYRLPKPEKLSQKQQIETPTNGLSWEKPESWIPSSGSSMRLASFDVPYSNGVGDVSVIQLGGTGGGFEANINRWRRQLNLEPQPISEIEKHLIENKGSMGLYNVIQIINDKLDSAFLCAILPAGNQTLFVKLNANPNGIHQIKADFISFCSSLIISD